MLKVVIIFVFNFYSFLIFSQQNNFIGGILFNVNGIQIEGNDTFWPNSNGSIRGGVGLSTGLSVQHYLLKKYYFNFEIRYIQKGSKFHYLDPYAPSYSELLRLNYIELPFSLGNQFIIRKKDFFIETGFAYAKLFSSKGNINEFVNRFGTINSENFKDYDISWFSSLKYPINNKNRGNLLLGLRFSYSLFTIHSNYKLKNMVYGLQLDYKFNTE